MRENSSRTWIILVVMILGWVSLSFAAYQNPPFVNEISSDGEVVGNHVLVQLVAGYSQADLATAVVKYGAVVEEQLPLITDWYVVSWNSLLSVETLYADMASEGIVKNVGYDHVFHLNQMFPADPLFMSEEWTMHDTQNPSYDIDAPEAWTITRGNANMTIYLLDSGSPAGCHPDFDNGNVEGTNSSFFTPLSPTAFSYGPEDNYGHATAMCTATGAEWDASDAPTPYYAGIAPNCKIVVAPVVQCYTNRFNQPAVGGNEVDAIRAMDWGINQWNPMHPTSPIRVVVTPWSYGTGYGNDAAMEQAIAALAQYNILLIASTGHHTSQQAGGILFPAVFSGWNYPNGTGFSNVLAVGAYERDGLDSGNPFGWSRFVFPNANAAHNLITAPGGITSPMVSSNRTADDIASDFPETCPMGMLQGQSTCGSYTRTQLVMPSNDPNGENQRGRFTGTSFAAAHVAGVAGLMFSLNTNQTPAQVKENLWRAVTAPVPANPVLGDGRLDAFRAVLRTPAA